MIIPGCVNYCSKSWVLLMFPIPSPLKHAGWNRRALDAGILDSIAVLEGIVVLELSTGYPGLYLLRHAIPIIVLDPALSGYRRDWVFAHELAHYYLHPSGVQLMYGPLKTIEKEADLIASCAVIPRPLYLARTHQELIKQGYPQALIDIRKFVYKETGL